MSLLTNALKTAVLVAPFLVDSAAAYWPKRGLAYNDDLNIAGFGGYQLNGKDSMVNWQYNWDSTTGEKQPWAEYVPMLWGTQNYHTDQWMDHANYWLDHGGSGHLLAFNEPEQGGQANLSPAAAANAYRQYMQPLGWKTNLGSPAVSNDGYEWMRQFLNECHDCKIDFLAIHWYNDHTQFGDFQNWVNSMCGLANGRQVWITEFEAFGSDDQQGEFLRQAIPWLDNNNCVFRYAYFGSADPAKQFLNGNGPGLSWLGQQYAFIPYGGNSL